MAVGTKLSVNTMTRRTTLTLALSAGLALGGCGEFDFEEEFSELTEGGDDEERGEGRRGRHGRGDGEGCNGEERGHYPGHHGEGEPGRHGDGTNPDGNNPDGNNPDGNNPDGTNPDGTNPDGPNPDGTGEPPPPPPPECRDYDEAGCLAVAECTPIYGGMNCVDSAGGECTSGDTDCTCETYAFAVCGDAG